MIKNYMINYKENINNIYNVYINNINNIFIFFKM